MATRTISSTGGNWNATTAWAEAAVPTASDDVVCTSSSASVTVNTSTCVCKSANFANYTGTLTINTNCKLTLSGDLTLVSGMEFAPSTYTRAIWFAGAANATLTSAGKRFSLLVVNLDSGYTLTLADALRVDMTTSGALELRSGGLNTASQTCTITFFKSTWTANTTTLNLGASTISLTGAGAAQWDCGSANAGLTVDSGTSSITISNTGYFYGGGKVWYDLTVGASIITRGSNTFRNFVCTAGQVSCYFEVGTTTTITGAFTSYGGNSLVIGQSYRVLIRSNQTTTLGQATLDLTGATVNVSYADFQDMVSTDGRDFSSITGGSGDRGGNSGFTFTEADSLYWHQNSGTEAFWTDSGHWFTVTNGGGSAARIPLPQDTPIFDSNSFDSDGVYVRNMISTVGTDIDVSTSRPFTLTANDPAQGVTSSLNLYGDTTLASGVTVNGSGLYFYGTGTITSNGGTFSASNQVYFFGDSTLGSGFSTGGGICCTTGHSLNAGNHDVTAKYFELAGEITMGSGTWTSTGYSSSNRCWDATGATLHSDTSTIVLSYSGSTNTTFCGGDLTYNDVSIGTGTAYTTILNANTFNMFTISAPKEVRFQYSHTHTFSSFVAVGDATHIITIQSSSTGSTAATLYDASGTNALEYLSVKNLTVTGGARWQAVNSTNVSGNTGWYWEAATTTNVNVSALTLSTSLHAPSFFLTGPHSVSVSSLGLSSSLRGVSLSKTQTGSFSGNRFGLGLTVRQPQIRVAKTQTHLTVGVSLVSAGRIPNVGVNATALGLTQILYEPFPYIMESRRMSLTLNMPSFRIVLFRSIGMNKVGYTGLTATSFTGCTGVKNHLDNMYVRGETTVSGGCPNCGALTYNREAK